MVYLDLSFVLGSSHSFTSRLALGVTLSLQAGKCGKMKLFFMTALSKENWE